MTEVEVSDFCDNLKKSLLESIRRRDPVAIHTKTFTRDVFGGQYGMPPDVILTGYRVTIDIGEPAKMVDPRDVDNCRYIPIAEHLQAKGK